MFSVVPIIWLHGSISQKTHLHTRRRENLKSDKLSIFCTHERNVYILIQNLFSASYFCWTLLRFISSLLSSVIPFFWLDFLINLSDLSYTSLRPSTLFSKQYSIDCEPGSSVSIVSGYGLDDWTIEARSPAEAKGFFLKRVCPYRFWGPPGLLYNGHRGSFPRG
jgi:hypothetical protein